MAELFQSHQSELIERIHRAAPANQELYLVGGAVRDALLQRNLHDLDFVLPGDPRPVARQVAKALKGAYYLMDAERLTARVVLKAEGSQSITLDFARQRGPDLDTDLRARDFTIDAMAVPYNPPYELYDPLGGALDLRVKRLRECSPVAFQDDPVRLLRGIRLALGLGLHIERDTLQHMKEAVSQLPRVSIERCRDELFRIFEGPQPDTAIRLLDRIHALEDLLPELPHLKGVTQSPPHTRDVWDHTLATVDALERIIAALDVEYQPDSAGNLALGMLVLQLGRFREQIYRELGAVVTPGRLVKGLLVLGAFYHDIAKPETWQRDENGRIRNFEHEQVGANVVVQVGKRLELSNTEINWLKILVRHHMRIHLLAQTSRLPSRKAVYRFFRDTGGVGVEVVLLTLADTLATYGASLDVDTWQKHLEISRVLLECWWEKPEESVNPPILLNGHDLQNELGLTPGAKIGELLAGIREAQAEGKISTRDQALEMARAWIANETEKTRLSETDQG